MVVASARPPEDTISRPKPETVELLVSRRIDDLSATDDRAATGQSEIQLRAASNLRATIGPVSPDDSFPPFRMVVVWKAHQTIQLACRRSTPSCYSQCYRMRQPQCRRVLSPPSRCSRVVGRSTRNWMRFRTFLQMQS